MKAGYWPFVLSAIALVSLGVQITLRAPLTERNVFSDDFSSYSLGSFPTSGGWELTYAGAGEQFQTIINTGGTTTKSLQLLGTNFNSALARKDVATSASVIEFEVSMKSDAHGGGANTVAEVGFYNADVNRFYPKIRFADDGTIWIEGDQSPLGHYVSQEWYELKVTVDKASKSFNMVIEGPSVKIDTKNRDFGGDNPDEIRSIAMTSGWAGVKVYFDDTSVFEETSAPIQTIQPILATVLPWISLGALWGVVLLLFPRDIKPSPVLIGIWSKRFVLKTAISLVGAFLITYFGVRNLLALSADTALLAGLAAATLALRILQYYEARKGTSTSPTTQQPP